MYEAVLEDSLRQGDVIKGIYFPRYSLPTLSLLHKLDKEGTPAFEDRALVKAQHAFAVVLSQCCEFQEGKRNAFSLARLFDVKSLLLNRVTSWGINLAQLLPARYQQLAVDQLRIANHVNVDHPEETKAINGYFYDAHGAILTEPYFVDFTQVFSVDMKDSSKILKLKVLQLDNEHRLEFQLKLGYFYTRPAGD
jgi:hypothetical protein